MSEEKIETTETEEIISEAPEKVDLASEVEKWKSLSRKNEAQAKANAQAAKELEELRAASLTDQERLIASTRQETELAVRREFANKLVDAELKSALTGKNLDAASLLSFDKNSFIDASGEVDSNAIAAWVEAHTKAIDNAAPDLGQGVRGKTISGVAQIRNRDELAKMTPDEINAARKDGRLNLLLGIN